MFFARMLVCSPLNLIHHVNECFGIEDTNGYYLTKDMRNLRINEMETERLTAISFAEMISKSYYKSAKSNKIIVKSIFRVDGAAEKTRTSTGFIPQRPQRCASTSSATAAIKILFCDNKMI